MASSTIVYAECSPKQTGLLAGNTRGRDKYPGLMDMLAGKAADHPIEHLGLQAIADLCEMSMWALRRRFGTAEQLSRTVALYQIDRVGMQLRGRPKPASAVTDAITSYAAFVASVMMGRDYRRALHLVLRHGQQSNWLAGVYQRQILGKICRDLQEAVAESGAVLGLPIALKEGAAEAFHNRLETELVLATLVPPFRQRGSDEIDTVVAAVSRDAFAATYAFAWEPVRPKQPARRAIVATAQHQAEKSDSD